MALIGRTGVRNALGTLRRTLGVVACCLGLIGALGAAMGPVPAQAAVTGSEVAGAGSAAVQAVTGGQEKGGSLESAATKAGETGRKVAMSLIGLAFAIAAVVLTFKRDFKEAAGVFVVGIFAVLLATPTGLSLLKDTVSSVFGS